SPKILRGATSDRVGHHVPANQKSARNAFGAGSGIGPEAGSGTSRGQRQAAKPLSGKQKNPASDAGFLKSIKAEGSGGECLHTLRETRDFPRGGVGVEDALRGGSHQLGLCGLESGLSGGLVARRKRLFHLAHEATHARPAVLVDGGLAL